MAEWFSELTQWHWLTLGVVLLILEIIGASGFLIGLAVASFVLAGIAALELIVSWQYQLLCFAALGMIFTVLYWRIFRRFNTQSDEPLMNDRAAQLIGRRLRLDSTLENGQGRVQIGDTFWKVEADDELATGTRIEIYDCEGMTLKVRPFSNHS
ncbi:NfeD family protein [Amphritea balenae]|uniref:NfeD family protein n=1 Tax=Amphritea balenae TaxID=452629 RepID=A0A3P1SR75_9GAMM|nr:NfeD family protein [Amphritea balenae]RRC99711.1 NfeD family protein [Amphritea balenae]GGK79194.1 membrane protein [Amphritea balenae]